MRHVGGMRDNVYIFLVTKSVFVFHNGYHLHCLREDSWWRMVCTTVPYGAFQVFLSSWLHFSFFVLMSSSSLYARLRCLLSS